MGKSLREQLLETGKVSKKQVKKVERDVRTEKKERKREDGEAEAKKRRTPKG